MSEARMAIGCAVDKLWHAINTAKAAEFAIAGAPLESDDRDAVLSLQLRLVDQLRELREDLDAALEETKTAKLEIVK